MFSKFFYKCFITVFILSLILSFSQSVFASSFNAKTLSNFKVINTFSVNQYTDVPSGSTFYENVKTGYEYGIMQGYGETFGVKNDITRLASIIIASRIHSIYNYGTNLADTQFLGTTRERYLAYAKKNAIFSAFDDYDVPATRAEFVAILSSSLPDEALPDINEVEYDTIPDVSVLAQYARDIYRFYRAGIVVGSDEKGTFYPDSHISRGAACAIATRMTNPNLRKAITLTLTPSDAFSIVQPYSACPEVPDFGVYNLVSVYASSIGENEIRFYYTHQSLEDAGTKMLSLYNYDQLLKEWGFKTAISYDNDDAINLVYYTKNTPQAYYTVYLGTLDSYNGVPCSSVIIQKVERASAQSYALHPKVPDFGAYFSLPLSNTADYSMGYYYYYDWLCPVLFCKKELLFCYSWPERRIRHH